jgi:hypothetical protein
MDSHKFPQQNILCDNKPYTRELLHGLLDMVYAVSPPFTGYLKFAGEDCSLFFLFFFNGVPYAAGRYADSKPAGYSIQDLGRHLAKSAVKSLSVSLCETDPALLKSMLLCAFQPENKVQAYRYRAMITAMSENSNQLDKDSLYKLLTVGYLNNRLNDDAAMSPTIVGKQKNRLGGDRERLPMPEIEGIEDSISTHNQKPKLQSVVLFVESGPQQGERFTVTLPCTIGRNECDLTLNDRLISRRHAELKLVENRLVIEDLASKNGTRVNGKTVTIKQVTTNDLISIGPTNLRIYPV